jgi:hypothetical protein
MTRVAVAVLLLHIVAALAAARGPCRFAPLFTSEGIWANATDAASFLDAHAAWEHGFVNELGVDPLTQLTYDGHRLDFTTGEPLGLPHLFSAPSKESVHIGLLARFLADSASPATAPRGDRSRHVFTSADAALSTLGKKVWCSARKRYLRRSGRSPGTLGHRKQRCKKKG